MVERAKNRIRLGVGACIATLASGLAFAQGDQVITQGDWAQLLAERLGISDVLALNAPADESAALLGTRGITINAGPASAVALLTDGALRTWRYDVETPRSATWLVTVNNSAPAFVSVDKTDSKLLPAGAAEGGADSGHHPLAAGKHAVTITMKGAAAPDLAMTAGCRPVLPAGGWQGSAKLTYGNLARTLVHALGQNGRLPAAEGLPAVAVAASRITVDAPSEGAYTVLLGGRALDRAKYRVDTCDLTTITTSATADGWREGATILLTAGTHTVSLFGIDPKLRDGKVRLVRRAAADLEYLKVLQSMGVKLEGGKSASLGIPTRTGLARRANGDETAGLPALAGKTVTRAEAERILGTPSIQKMLSKGGGFPKPPAPPNDSKKDDEVAGTLVEPVTSTLQQTQEADPR